MAHYLQKQIARFMLQGMKQAWDMLRKDPVVYASIPFRTKYFPSRGMGVLVIKKNNT